MNISSNVASMIRSISASALSTEEYEEILGMILERAFEETLKLAPTAVPETPRKKSKIPGEGTLTRQVYECLQQGISNAPDICKHLELHGTSTTGARVSALLKTLTVRGLAVRSERGSYTPVAR